MAYVRNLLTISEFDSSEENDYAHTYHWCQAPLIGFRERVVIIYGSDDMMEIEGVS